MKIFYKILIALNKILFPKYWKKDLAKLSPLQKLIVGYKIWLGKKAVV